MDKQRIDNLLTQLGLADSRAKAQALVMSGVVLVDEKRVEKSSEKFAIDATVRIKGASDETKYVSRGGLKLEAAIAAAKLDIAGLVCLDIGSSTGGFTDCMLKHGAKSVTCVDSGTNQLSWQLRSDERVEVRENVNARYLKPDDFEIEFDLAVMDVSFISVTKIIPAIVPLLAENANVVILIKPQFEVGRGEVGKGGIVKDAEKHERVVAEVNEFAIRSGGLDLITTIDSPIFGATGNKEFLSVYTRR